MAVVRLQAALRRLATPLSLRDFVLLAAAVLLANTLYCLAYTALNGRGETIAQAVGWSVVNILPWLAAFELGKARGRIVLPVAGALLASLLLGALVGTEQSWSFELVRRLPAAGLTAVVLLALRRIRAGADAAAIDLPLLPAQIRWVAAAGNYVELHGGARPVLVRVPLARVADTLSGHGFVRVHRSTLVNRARIARVRTRDLLLDDGTALPLGPRYRHQLVPSSLSAPA